MVWTPTCSFAGVPFSTQQDQGPGVEEAIDQVLQFAVTTSPSGDSHWVQIAGREPVQWSRAIIVPIASWAALEGKVGLQGTLSVHGRSYTATMLALRAKRIRPGLLAAATGLWLV